jgi:hypothetical protein
MKHDMIYTQDGLKFPKLERGSLASQGVLPAASWRSLPPIPASVYLVCLIFFAVGRLVYGQEADPALLPAEIIQPVPEEWRDDDKRLIWQAMPSMTVAPNGRLWVCWYSGGDGDTSIHNYVLLATSNDKGKTWSKPLLAIAAPGPVRCFDPSMWTDPEKNVNLFWTQSNRHWDGRGGVWHVKLLNAENEEITWTQPRRLCDGIMFCKPIADSKGRYILPAAVWNSPPDHLDRTLVPGAHFVVSEDKGKTWTSFGHSTLTRREANYDEHNIVEKKDGSFWLLHRSKSGMYQSFSTDGGKMWSKAVPGYPHTSSKFFVRRLKSGNLLFVKHGMMDEKTPHRSHLRAFISEDDGKTWKGGLMLDERNEVSFPDGDQAEDGTIYVAYDFERYGAREILMTRFTEEDVLAGKIIGKDSALRLLVNKATGMLVNKATGKPPTRP